MADNKETLNDRLAGGVPSEKDLNFNSNNSSNKKMSGYRIAIALLAVILVALSVLYYNIHSQQQADYALLSGERDSIQSNLTELVGKYDKLETNNDELKAGLAAERGRVDSLMTQLKKERSFNYTKLKQYEKEVSTLRDVMRGYLEQIDSLNNLNQELLSQNVSYKKQITQTELRAEKAEELAAELNNQVRKGALLIAQGITITPLNDKSREVSRVKRAEQLSVNFTVAANKLTKSGNKEIYARITSPDGYVLATDKLPTFKLNGENVTYSASRSVNYQNKDLPVSIFFNGTGFVEGTYQVELYTDGVLMGSTKLELR